MLRYYSIIFSFFLTCLLTFSCRKEGNIVTRPDNLIEEKKMVDLLVATHILEQQINEARLTKIAKEDSFRVYQEEIFVEMNLDSTAFFSSYKYYASQIDQFQKIMLTVADSLSYLRDHANDNPTSKKGEEKSNNREELDSLRK